MPSSKISIFPLKQNDIIFFTRGLHIDWLEWSELGEDQEQNVRNGSVWWWS